MKLHNYIKASLKVMSMSSPLNAVYQYVVICISHFILAASTATPTKCMATILCPPVPFPEKTHEKVLLLSTSCKY